MTYAEKLKDPRWQKKRLKILDRDKWTCQHCLETERTLHVHHSYYEKDKEPWDYPDKTLITLCSECHQVEKELSKEWEYELIQTLKREGFSSINLEHLEMYIRMFFEKHKKPRELTFKLKKMING